MDSMKANLLQQQEFPKKNTQKPYILTFIFVLTLIVTGILTVTTVIVIRQSSPGSDYSLVEPTPSKYIQALCSFAPHKHLCSSSILSSISTNTSSNYEFAPYLYPENIIFHSFQVAVTQLTHLANITKPNGTAESVLLECQALLNKELSGLNDSVSSFRNFYSFTKTEAGEYVAILNMMETNQQACLDKLEESSTGSTMINEIRLNVEKTRRYMSNTIAVLQNIDSVLDNLYGYPSSGTVDYYSYYFYGLSYEYMIIFVPQYVFLILLFILMLKLY
ncbi:hypothetical protein POM88_038989 [Heracleum sosnowskyi]|uniref:Pectinesterase inhibitor domain-containing protein n=1 Tax=Heracleum sosnowskyi TaxID=360622 RepID=A0AAD8HBG5_9APIA|nr:hypothetical protein POM88_038989 [Heracleum sosnowskyi]